ncbi:biotin--[acetyl-CoA-carboxylase] ligase [Sphingomonas metalli]|uniref:biotin--[biotin carboxyl-carrier protein] ligase n=1 Tax=Sphingomonas metalli TaxID=1779358 RepID=A0A916T746_9SPHN|nr:biotin--[acetyl-CoA-carboxylase] ligase [Sphingomonas metalli]GGB34131.1 biotin--[acetyl-CoA-carboxylase] ligase [Sphingomonas metalli]
MRTVAETGSTNADLLDAARHGAAEGSWLRAERQTAGRGRHGRDWVSPTGNLYASTLVRLRRSDPPAPTLALVAGIAVQEAVSVFLPGATRLKWPNDLLADGAKLAGILLERADDAVVVGIGVNIAHHPDLSDRPTTSLADRGEACDATLVFDVLREGFARWLARWRGEGLAKIRARWLADAHPIGTPLSLRAPDGSLVEGLFDGLDPDGALTLRLAGGGRRVIHAGDVFLIRGT